MEHITGFCCFDFRWMPRYCCMKPSDQTHSFTLCSTDTHTLPKLYSFLSSWSTATLAYIPLQHHFQYRHTQKTHTHTHTPWLMLSQLPARWCHLARQGCSAPVADRNVNSSNLFIVSLHLIYIYCINIYNKLFRLSLVMPNCIFSFV